MIHVKYVPRRDDHLVSYTFAGDRIIAIVDDVVEEYDFATLADGELIALEDSVLPIQVLVGARRMDGELHVQLVRAIPARPTKAEELDSWLTMWADLAETIDGSEVLDDLQAHKATLVWRSQAEINTEKEAQAWASLRAERNRRLAETDWIMLPDAPVPVGTTREQWEAYRQALRDVPQQPGAPWDVTWPTPPTGDVTEE